MTENVRKTFDMLGVEPDERFKIKTESGFVFEDKYYISENLVFFIDKEGYSTGYDVLDVIKGYVEIIKIPKYEFTKEEKDILKALKNLNFKYIVRDDYNDELTACAENPSKGSISWYANGEYIILDQDLFSFIKWEDSEPFEIPDIEDESEYETDEKKIEEKLLEIYLKTKQKCDNLTCKECPYDTVNHIECEVNLFIDELIANNFTFLKSEE